MIYCNAAKLNAIVSTLAKLWHKPTHPTAVFVISTRADRLTLLVNDGYSVARACVPADCEEDFMTTVRCADWKKAVATAALAAGQGDIALDVQHDSASIDVRGGAVALAVVHGVAPLPDVLRLYHAELPPANTVLDACAQAQAFSVPRRVFHKVAERAAPSMNTDETRPGLSGLHLSTLSGCLHVDATDGHRHIRCETLVRTPPDFDVLAGAADAEVVLAAFRGRAGDDVRVGVSAFGAAPRYVSFADDTFTFALREPPERANGDGSRWPDVGRLVPDDALQGQYEARVSAGGLADALKAVPRTSRNIELYPSGEHLNIKSTDGVYTARVACTLLRGTPPFAPAIFFTPYLREAFLPGDGEITLKISGEHYPAVITVPGAAWSLVMPVRR